MAFWYSRVEKSLHPDPKPKFGRGARRKDCVQGRGASFEPADAAGVGLEQGLIGALDLGLEQGAYTGLP